MQELRECGKKKGMPSAANQCHIILSQEYLQVSLRVIHKRHWNYSMLQRTNIPFQDEMIMDNDSAVVSEFEYTTFPSRKRKPGEDEKPIYSSGLTCRRTIARINLSIQGNTERLLDNSSFNFLL